MAVWVSMLRGINLGKRRVKMEELRALYESLGFTKVETYVQSGNVVFRAARAGTKMAATIEEAIEKRFGFQAASVLRTGAELRATIAANPFAAREGIDGAKLLVWFLAADPGEEARRKARAIAAAAPEEVVLAERELYIYFPNGMARPKLSMTAMERAIRVQGTGRNWNTVRKLAEMAEAQSR